VAAFIAAQRDAHGVPHAVSCRALGVSQSWLYKWKDAAESRDRAAVRKARGQGRVTADHRRAARGGLAGEREHGRGPDARAGPGRPPGQEGPQRHYPAGKGRWRAPDLIGRQFPAVGINRKWDGDGTEIVTDEGKLYLLVMWNQAGQRRGLDHKGSCD